MKNTREKILRSLLTYPGSSIKDLANAVGINDISIRHHLKTLEAEGFVSPAEERHGVGRPHLVYTLTEKGVEQFPTRYLRLTHRLLSELKKRFTKEELIQIFQNIGKEIAEKFESITKETPLEERINFVVNILKIEGFVVEWQKHNEHYRIISLSCPYYQIGIDHPEICKIDQSLISSFFKEPLQVTSCIADGDNCCTYEIYTNLEKEIKYE